MLVIILVHRYYILIGLLVTFLPWMVLPSTKASPRKGDLYVRTGSNPESCVHYMQCLQQ